VTLQPLRRFALDAAIVFSDILIIPEAMGQPYHFREGGGIGMDFRIGDAASIEALNEVGVAGRLDYLRQALVILRKELPDKALLGFGGSPWTLATYMVEGGSAKEFTALKQLYYSDRSLFVQLMQKLTTAVIELFRMQIDAGVDAIQIFDSWGAACPAAEYETMSLCWIRAIIESLPKGFPVILYAKGMSPHLQSMLTTGCRGLSLDWTVDLCENFYKGRCS
jgi:uroporphyrinogen decarboxylase